jgi:histidyl-tRNA synthetase
VTTFRAPKGTDDILPPESRRWRHLLRSFDDWAERYGYDLVLTPLFEATELFSRGVGEDTEVVEKQMYTFTDKAGRSLTLRPEQTASVVRAYLEAGRQGVFKVAYAGPQFRYERPQAGRRRQFFQLGVEYLDEDSPAADVEVIELGYRYLDAIGLADVEVQLNSIGTPASRPKYRQALLAYLRDRSDQLSPDSQARLESNPMRVLDSKVDAPKLTDAPAPIDYLDDASAAHFESVQAGLRDAGVPFVVSPRLVRGLDYYTRTVFEYVPSAYGAAQNAVGGGGRYDGLTELLGGPPTPALGFALGLDRILLALGDPAADGGGLDAFVVIADRERRGVALELVRRLRGAGLRVDMAQGDRSVKAQFKAADRRAATTALVVGEEWEQGMVTARELAAGTQDQISLEEVEEWVRSR